MVRPSRRRSLVAWLRRAYQVSERRMCRPTGLARSSHRSRSTADPQHELRLKELAAARVRYGYRRLPGRLRREGWPINAKRVSRRDLCIKIRNPPTCRRSSLNCCSNSSLVGSRFSLCWLSGFGDNKTSFTAPSNFSRLIGSDSMGSGAWILVVPCYRCCCGFLIENLTTSRLHFPRNKA